MKEAIGTSYVFTLVMTFVGILIAMFVGSIAYTKGFKVRNKIIDIIDKEQGYTLRAGGAKDQIDQSLAKIGYLRNRNGTSYLTHCKCIPMTHA